MSPVPVAVVAQGSLASVVVNITVLIAVIIGVANYESLPTTT